MGTLNNSPQEAILEQRVDMPDTKLPRHTMQCDRVDCGTFLGNLGKGSVTVKHVLRNRLEHASGEEIISRPIGGPHAS